MIEGARIVVTGCAGFIGMHVCSALLNIGAHVTGIDALTPYYDTNLKLARLERLEHEPCFAFIRADIADPLVFPACLDGVNPDYIIHLAAQPGVRHSLHAPLDYIRDNVHAHTAICDYARSLPHLKHLLYASSSSVYGSGGRQPFHESDPVNRPDSLYAATKASAELISRSYAHLYGTPQTGLRFFTVYGPWGRPDMAPMLFLSAIDNGDPIRVFNHGYMKRDFTYIDDIVTGIIKLLPCIPENESAHHVPHRIVNLGSGNPVSLTDFITTLEQCADRQAVKIYVDMQQGDVEETYADVSLASSLCNFTPSVALHHGLKNFVAWYRTYRNS